MDYDKLQQEGQVLQDLYFILRSKDSLEYRKILVSKEKYAMALSYILAVLEQVYKEKPL